MTQIKAVLTISMTCKLMILISAMSEDDDSDSSNPLKLLMNDHCYTSVNGPSEISNKLASTYCGENPSNPIQHVFKVPAVPTLRSHRHKVCSLTLFILINLIVLLKSNSNSDVSMTTQYFNTFETVKKVIRMVIVILARNINN